ncbi:hypothetical protein FB45DRAFT_1029822 [Roridomyces roridus]|uniref:Uncharacterized protein n=1 Tax=Roridomyces roridus TaxID=1738132 RepID=A0AAD7BQJ6_9AGAR|nr:hypothetical protein FB45DRAFT_1029822 [Roridomyces roridus]
MATRDYYRDFGAERDRALTASIALVKGHETTWSTREAAFEYMRHKFPWKSWDPRVLYIHVNHGLYESSTGEICSNNHPELCSYREIPPHLDAADQYRRIVGLLPIHFILGGRNSFASPEAQQSILDTKHNIQPSSVQRVTKARHQVLQENPDGLADAICSVLENLDSRVGLNQRPRL